VPTAARIHGGIVAMITAAPSALKHKNSDLIVIFSFVLSRRRRRHDYVAAARSGYRHILAQFG
jgi:hypothetical protein